MILRYVPYKCGVLSSGTEQAVQRVEAAVDARNEVPPPRNYSANLKSETESEDAVEAVLNPAYGAMRYAVLGQRMALVCNEAYGTRRCAVLIQRMVLGGGHSDPGAHGRAHVPRHGRGITYCHRI